MPNEVAYKSEKIVRIEIQSKVFGRKEVIIDAEDYPKIEKYTWFIVVNSKQGIIQSISAAAHGGGRQPMVAIQHVIMGKKWIDHINGNVFDNRKENLRECTPAQNAYNRSKYKTNKSGFKGVSWSKSAGKYKAQICKDRHVMSIGYFEDKIDAAKAYNRMAKTLFGEFARLNDFR